MRLLGQSQTSLFFYGEISRIQKAQIKSKLTNKIKLSDQKIIRA